MARKCKWQLVTGYEDHAPFIRLTADGGALSEADCIQVARALLDHVDGMRVVRVEKTKARKQHEADIAFEEAEARRTGSHRKV